MLRKLRFERLKGVKTIYYTDGDIRLQDFDAGFVGVDTEFMGLNFQRDRLCLIQVFNPRRQLAGLIKLDMDVKAENFPNLKILLENQSYRKIFHFGYADLMQLYKTFGFKIRNVDCTRTMSKLARSYTNSHSLKTLVSLILKKNLNKAETCTYGGSKQLSSGQLIYSLEDVLYLHLIQVFLSRILLRERRMLSYQRFRSILPLVVENQIEGWGIENLISY